MMLAAILDPMTGVWRTTDVRTCDELNYSIQPVGYRFFILVDNSTLMGVISNR